MSIIDETTSFPETQAYSGAPPGKGWLEQSRLLSQDFQSLSLFRILLAMLLAFDFVWDKLSSYSIFFNDYGLIPRTTVIRLWGHRANNFSLFYIDNSFALHAAIYVLHALAILAFGIGFRTRMATIVLVITWTSFCMRNEIILSNAELAIKLFLIWACFLPMNRYWSVDAALDPAARDRPYPKIPFLALKLQLAIIYFFSAFMKLGGEPWIQGNSIHDALMDNWVGGTTGGLYIALHTPHILLLVSGYLVIAFQFGFSALIYCPVWNNVTRGIALAGAFVMHGAFLILLNIGYFPFVCWSYLVLLIPDNWWNTWLKKRRDRLSKIRIYYDGDCGFCLKTALILREFCLPVTVPVAPANRNPEALHLLKTHNSWVVYDETGKPRLTWDAVSYVLKKSPAFFWLGYCTDMTCMQRTMEKVYDAIGRNRPKLGQLTSSWLPIRNTPPLHGAAQVLCAMMATLSLLHNIFTLPQPAIHTAKLDEFYALLQVPEPRWIKSWSGYTEVSQRWNIFAPYPFHWYHKINIVGTLKDGSAIDVFQYWKHGHITLNDNGWSATFDTFPWEKFYSSLDTDKDDFRQSLGLYLCREFNRKTNPIQLKAVTIDVSDYDISEKRDLTLPTGAPTIHQTTTVDCHQPET